MRTNALRVTIRDAAVRRFVSLCLIGFFACATFSGCSRKFWREQAEKDTYDAIAERMNDQRWALPRINTTPDVNSRFYDPNDPDCGPLPPDDPAAHAYMHSVNGKRGYKSWHKLGTSLSVENPHWLAPYGIQMTEAGDPVVMHNQVQLKKLKLQDALELSYIHSRDYQNEIENQYLSALDLTFERFRFDVRYLGSGGGRPGSGLVRNGNLGATNTLTGSSNFGIRQLLPSGAQWAVELTNNSVWLLSSGGGRSAASTLSYQLVQPLLAGAGRKIVLEDLTQAERDVLYSTRSLARFRKTFFAATAGEYLDLMRQQQIILNQVNNIKQLLEQLEIQASIDQRVNSLLTENFDNRLPAGVKPEIPADLKGRVSFNRDVIRWRRRKDQPAISDADAAAMIGMSDNADWVRAATELAGRTKVEPISLQFVQLRTQLNNSLNTLEGQKRVVQDQLDTFKIQMGLPPDIEMTVDDSLLKRFQLISPEVIAVESRLKALTDEYADLEDADEIDFGRLKKFISEIDEQREEVAGGILESIRAGFNRVESLLTATKDDLNATSDDQRAFATEEERERVAEDLDRDRRLLAASVEQFDELSARLQILMSLVDHDSVQDALKANGGSDSEVNFEKLPRLWRQNQVDKDESDTVDVGEFLAATLREARDLREKILRRTQSMQVYQIGPNVDVVASNLFHLPGQKEAPSMAEAVRIGLDNRLDLMNSRAAIMDARRAAEVAANDLESVLDVTVEGSLPNGRGSNHSVGIQFTAPLDQVQARNIYSRATILYQRARRDYMALEDSIKQSIRSNHRQLKVLRNQLEIDRQTIRNAALELDNVVNQQQNPVQSGNQNSLNLLRALDSVLSAQNSFVRNWFNYENNRINIFRDMGIMDIDQRGIWTDNFYQQAGLAVPEFTPDASITDPAPFPPLENSNPTATDPQNTVPNSTPMELKPVDDLMNPPDLGPDLQGLNQKQDDSNVYPITRADFESSWNLEYLDDPRVAHRSSRGGHIRTVAADETDNLGVRQAEAGLFEVYP